MLRPGARPVHFIKSLIAAECARADIRDARRVWTAYIVIIVMSELQQHNVVLLPHCSGDVLDCDAADCALPDDHQ